MLEMCGGSSETPRWMHALDAGERKVKVVNIAGVVNVGGQDSSKVGETEVADFRVNTVEVSQMRKKTEACERYAGEEQQDAILN